jgi:tRNA(Ile)-lysidine synthase
MHSCIPIPAAGCWLSSIKARMPPRKPRIVPQRATPAGTHVLEDVAAVLRLECGLDPHLPVIVGVSGGPDSLCLLHVLCALGYDVVVAHFDHGLRPEASLEAASVSAQAMELDVPCILGKGRVRQHAQDLHLSIEEAARELRYAFLFAQARQQGAQAVAVGHTADDQAETVLLHLLRGAGLNGLTGMAHRSILRGFDPSIPLVRPLLRVWREDTVSYCNSQGLRPQYDATNRSPEFLRNRIRNELIPAMETYNPRVRAALVRTSQTLSADASLLSSLIDTEWGRVVSRVDANFIQFDAERLPRSSDLNVHLVRRAAEMLVPGISVTHAVLQRAAGFLTDSSVLRRAFGEGLILFREGEHVYVARGETALPSDAVPQMPAGVTSLSANIPGVLTLAGGWQFRAVAPRSLDPSDIEALRTTSRFTVLLDADQLPSRLELRVRRPGDRLRSLGMVGHSQKLSDFFVNAKVPRRARDRWPLLCSGEVLIWVPGFRPAQEFSVQPTTKRVLVFSVCVGKLP